MEESVIPDDRLYEFVVESEDVNERVDIFLAQNIPEASRSQVQRLIREGQLRINDQELKKANYKLELDDRIHFRFAEAVVHGLEPQQVDFEILYEDQDLIVVNKPAGLMVHPGAGRREPTLIEGILYHLRENNPFNQAEMESGRPGIVHRLDADTSGAMVIAKNTVAHAHLSQQFHDKNNIRIYKALLCGELKESDLTVQSYLYRDPHHRTSFASISSGEYLALCQKRRRNSLPGYKYAESYFKKEKAFQGSATLVSVKLKTGRTHQIRVHARAIHRPVAGDPTYGGDMSMVRDPRVAVVISKLKRQMLHAETIGITHPVTGQKMAFQARPPDDFAELLDFLRSLT